MDDRNIKEKIATAQQDDILLKDVRSVAEQFRGLPLSDLISAPLIEAAKGQQELTSIYVDGILQVADKKGQILDICKADDAKVQKFSLKRPTNIDSEMIAEEVEMKAPSRFKVPVPAFTVAEATVDFTVGVQELNEK